MGKKRSRGKKNAELKDNDSAKNVENVKVNAIVKDHDQFLSETEAVAKTTLNKEPSNPIPKTEVKIVEKEVEKIVEKVVKDPSLVKQVKELKEENANLEKEMDVLRTQLSSSQSDELKMYQDVLQKTETLLRNLQKSVEEEEKQFLKKLQARDEQICQLERENQKLSLQQDLKTYCDSSEFSENERDLATLRRALEGERVQTVALKQRCALLEKELSDLKGKSNGMLNGPSENEDGISHSDSTSIVSLEAMSCSSKSEDDLAKGKKKKNFFSKLIRKSPSKEVKTLPIAE